MDFNVYEESQVDENHIEELAVEKTANEVGIVASMLRFGCYSQARMVPARQGRARWFSAV
jgi:hypothetical protein